MVNNGAVLANMYLCLYLQVGTRHKNTEIQMCLYLQVKTTHKNTEIQIHRGRGESKEWVEEEAMVATGAALAAGEGTKVVCT